MKGRLFGPDLPGSGVPVEAEWQAERLLFQLAEGELASGELRIEAGGFNSSQVRITFTAARGSYAFLVETQDVPGLLHTVPPGQRSRFEAAAARPRALDRRLRFAALAGLVVGLVGFLGAWLGVSWAASRLAQRISPAHEQLLGELVLAQVRATTPLIEDGAALDAVRTLGDALTPGSRYRYRYFLAQSGEINAFAAPGGIVVVNTGLIGVADGPEELAGVLAHEVAHAELRHGTAALLKSAGIGVLWSWLLGGLDPDYARLAGHFSELKFSRDAERQADAEGLRRLRAARLDESGMITMFEKLAKQSASGVVPPVWFSTHPDVEERLAWLRKHARIGAGARSLSIDWPKVKEAIQRR